MNDAMLLVSDKDYRVDRINNLIVVSGLSKDDLQNLSHEQLEQVVKAAGTIDFGVDFAVTDSAAVLETIDTYVRSSLARRSASEI